jgi:hypothetical protein
MEERQKISTTLWMEVDEELQALQEFVQDQIHKPVSARSKTGFPFKVGVLPKKGK